MTAGHVRAIYFDYLNRRLKEHHGRRVGHALSTLSELRPHLYDTLQAAHDGDRSSVNWKLESEAVEELGRIFDILGITRTGVRDRSRGVANLAG